MNERGSLSIEDDRSTCSVEENETPTVEKIIDVITSNNDLLYMKCCTNARKSIMINHNLELIEQLKKKNDVIKPSLIEEKLSMLSHQIEEKLSMFSQQIEEKLSMLGRQVEMVYNAVNRQQPADRSSSEDNRNERSDNISVVASNSPFKLNNTKKNTANRGAKTNGISQEGDLTGMYKPEYVPLGNKVVSTNSFFCSKNASSVQPKVISSSIRANSDLVTRCKLCNFAMRKDEACQYCAVKQENMDISSDGKSLDANGTGDSPMPVTRSSDSSSLSFDRFHSKENSSSSKNSSSPSASSDLNSSASNGIKLNSSALNTSNCEANKSSMTSVPMTAVCSGAISTLVFYPTKENSSRNSSRLNASSLDALNASALNTSSCEANKKYEVDYLFVGTHRFISQTFIRITTDHLILNIASLKESINIDFKLIKCLHHHVGKIDNSSRYTYLKIDFREQAVGAINEYLSQRSQTDGTFRLESNNSHETTFVVKLKFMQSPETKELRDRLRMHLPSGFKEDPLALQYFEEQRNYYLSQRSTRKRQNTSVDIKTQHQDSLRDAVHENVSKGFEVAKKRKIEIEPDFEESHEDECFMCGEVGQLVMCDSRDCPKSYHLACLNLKTLPTGEWICPVHHCNVCEKKAIKFCNHCPASFCKAHQSNGEMEMLANGELICNAHTIAYLHAVKRKKN